MKIKSLLIGMLACSAMVACTNTDEPEVNNGNENGDAKAYMKVQLVMNDVSGSRATDGGYADGETKEQTITSDNSIFLFYDAAGNYITFGKVVGGTATEDGHTNNIDIHYPAYIALSGPDQSIKQIKQVLTVVNYGANKCKALQNINLKDALIKTSEATIEGSDGTFLMTTAVYLETSAKGDDGIAGNDIDSDKISNTTKISDGDFYEDQKTATTAGNPVVIHIERAAAKVQVIANTEPYDVKDDADETLSKDAGDIHVDGVLNKIQIKVTGWKLNNINPSTKIMKDIYDWTATAPFDGWNITWTSGSDTYGRSFWSKGTLWDYAGLADLADLDENATHKHKLTAYAYKDATTATTTAAALTTGYEYCWEQTVEEALATRGTAYPNVTTVLIAAQVVLEDGTSPDLYKNNGVYYTESTYKKLILQQLMDAGYAKTVENGSPTAYFAESDLTFNTVSKSLAGFTVTVSTTGQLKGADGAYTAATVDAINTAIAQLPCVNGAVGYKEGKCFYQIPIEHLSSATGVNATVPAYGVVRNHWYQLTISGIKHIGEAVYNPEVEIPQIPPQNTEYYMAAELHVLSWKVVNQNVTLD